MVDVETKRRLAKSWLRENIRGVGDTVSEKYVDHYVDEDSESLIGAMVKKKESANISHAPSGMTGKIIRSAYEDQDPIAPVTDVDLIYANIAGTFILYKEDPETEDEWDAIENDNLLLMYASEEGKKEHLAHNI